MNLELDQHGLPRMSMVLKGKSTLLKIPLILAHDQSTNFKPFVAHLTSTQCFELFMSQ
jgi:hypothetical protein